MFEAAETIPSGEIKAYRRFAFPPALGDPSHNPFFSVENASAWITSHGYQLYLQHNDSESSLWDPDKATVNQIRAYRNYMLGDHFLGHLFFDLDNTEAWINLVAFQAYMNTVHGSFNECRTQNSTSFSSCPPSRAESPPCFIVPASRAPSSEAPSPFVSSVIVLSDSDSDKFPAAVSTASLVPKSNQVQLHPFRLIQRSLHIEMGAKAKRKQLPVDSRTRIRGGGSSGHSVGDSEVVGFLPDLTTAIKCRRAHLKCKGVYTCEFIDPSHFEGCERYEPDPAATQALWKAELDANEREAASAAGIVSRWTGASYGKQFFIGCSKWTGARKFEHRYLPIPNNVDEDTLRIAMENGGRLPTAPTVNEMCALTVHPRIGKRLKTCPYTHIMDGQIKSGRLVQCKCEAMMIIFTPVNPPLAARHKALVIVRGPHNHPAHPKTKPSTSAQYLLGQAIDAAGSLGLTVNKLLNAPSTTLIYGGERVSTSSPAYMNTRKVMDLINKKKEDRSSSGNGLGRYFGVVHHFTKEASLLPVDRYLHTTMAKNGFRLAVTMHPQIVLFIHQVLSINIDFTFKRVEGLTFASLFCDAKTTEAFTQLFTELFDTIARATGKPLKLAPFFPDAKCRIVMLDGEVPQALGLGNFPSGIQ
ncbi:hypothetical protein B0H14DRAFT_2627657 [Mycena olivaceomarginata]|nr:hypothetical protein B0H14DRAFT_2627657 [Mycena olivaceomarginata]